MKYIHGLLLLVLVASQSSLFGEAPIPPEIENPEIFQINKLPPRSHFWPHPSPQSAEGARYAESPWVESLNGTWKFHWCPTPEQRPLDFHQSAFDTSAWDDIPVPSTWEREGYGTPLYRNYGNMFKASPPKVMGTPSKDWTTYVERNPVGSYVRDFEVPASWAGQRIILHFGGARSAMFVWVNGHKVGYSQGGRLPAEFDITDLLKSGKNKVAVEVYKYSDASWIEDIDFWRLSGLFRDVMLVATPPKGLWDVYAQPDYNPETGQGSVTLHTTPMPGANPEVKMSIFDPAGKKLAEGTGTLELGKVQAWWAEKPATYRAKIEVSHQGELVSAYDLPVGFRKTEVQGEVLLLNGKPLKIRGVNRHEFDPHTGYVVDEELMAQDLEMLKKMNANFVRNAHYPADPRWYELCNEQGLWLMDEAHLESHGISYHKRVLPGDKPEWEAAVVDRMHRMVISSRQHPSVVMWSYGNEAGFGNAFFAMKDAYLKADPERRMTQYADMNLVADVDSQTYPLVSWLKQHIKGKAKRKGERGERTFETQHGPYPSGRPFLMNEYAHGLGNTNGNLVDYWDLIYAEPMLAGGFMWDLVDQNLYRDRNDPSKGYVYGGYFGDYPTSTVNYDGIITAERDPNPQFYEVQKVYQPVHFFWDSQKPEQLEVKNLRFGKGLEDYALLKTVLADGEVVFEQTQDRLNIGPNETVSVAIAEVAREARRQEQKGREVVLAFHLTLKESTPWAERGHAVAKESFAWGPYQEPSIEFKSMALSTSKVAEGLAVQAGDLNMILSSKTGLPTSLQVEGRETLMAPMAWNFTRVSTDVDLGRRDRNENLIWKDAHKNLQVSEIQPLDASTIKALVEIPDKQVEGHVLYRVDEDSRLKVEVELRFNKKFRSIPRLGMSMLIPRPWNNVEWYGRGPQENYWDRKTGAFLGVYESTVEAWDTHYARPQANANRSDVRWAAWTDGSGKGLAVRAMGDAPLSVSAWPYSKESLEKAKYDFELEESPYITVNIDHLQMGVGGDYTWGASPYKHYTIPIPGTYNWSFLIDAL
ncbi:MAG: glycoside hydrolase family 2 TIM barrel-domain containing protein [Opitutales bacterium]